MIMMFSALLYDLTAPNPSQIYSIKIHRFWHQLGTIPFNVARIIIQHLTNCLNLLTSQVPIFVDVAGTSISMELECPTVLP